MKRLAASLLLLASPLASLLSTRGALAYTLEKDSSGAPVRWPKGTLTFYVDPTSRDVQPDAVMATAARAAQHWEAVSPVHIDVVSENSHGTLGYDPDHPSLNRNEIVFADDDWEYDEDAVATTLLTYDASTHAILDADIILDGRAHRFGALADDSKPGQGLRDDLESALTHEIGHSLGMAHNPQLQEATMYPSTQPGEVSKRHLSQDDEQGVQALYDAPASAQPRANPGSQAAGGGCGAAPGQGDLLLGLLIVASLAWRKSRRSATAALVLAATTFASRSASAAPRAPSLAALGRAEVVAEGRVLEVTAHRTGGLIHTRVVVSVDRCLKGSCPTTLVYEAPGGRLGNLEQRVDDQPAPELGERLAVALVPSRDGGLRPAALHGAQVRLEAR